MTLEKQIIEILNPRPPIKEKSSVSMQILIHVHVVSLHVNTNQAFGVREYNAALSQPVGLISAGLYLHMHEHSLISTLGPMNQAIHV